MTAGRGRRHGYNGEQLDESGGPASSTPRDILSTGYHGVVEPAHIVSPLARLKCVSEKRLRDLAGRLLKSREASDRDYNPQPCLFPTSLWCEK